MRFPLPIHAFDRLVVASPHANRALWSRHVLAQQTPGVSPLAPAPVPDPERAFGIPILGAGVPSSPSLYWLEEHSDEIERVDTFRLRAPGDTADNAPIVTGLANISVYVLTVSVTVGAMGRFMDPRTWDELAPDPRHRNALLTEFVLNPTRRATELYVPIRSDQAPPSMKLDAPGPAPLDRRKCHGSLEEAPGKSGETQTRETSGRSASGP